eukprot:scaffold60194_cov67-Phaeocystis_antarctica.AAC.5
MDSCDRHSVRPRTRRLCERRRDGRSRGWRMRPRAVDRSDRSKLHRAGDVGRQAHAGREDAVVALGGVWLERGAARTRDAAAPDAVTGEAFACSLPAAVALPPHRPRCVHGDGAPHAPPQLHTSYTRALLQPCGAAIAAEAVPACPLEQLDVRPHHVDGSECQPHVARHVAISFAARTEQRAGAAPLPAQRGLWRRLLVGRLHQEDLSGRVEVEHRHHRTSARVLVRRGTLGPVAAVRRRRAPRQPRRVPRCSVGPVLHAAVHWVDAGAHGLVRVAPPSVVALACPCEERSGLGHADQSRVVW